MRLFVLFVLVGAFFTFPVSAQRCVTIGYWAEESDQIKNMMSLIERAYQKAGVCYQTKVTSRPRALRYIGEGQIGALGWAKIDYVTANSDFVLGLRTPLGYSTFDLIFDQKVIGENFDPRAFKNKIVAAFRADEMAHNEVIKLDASLIKARYLDQLVALLQSGRVAAIIIPSLSSELDDVRAKLGKGYGVKVYNGTTYLHVMHKKYKTEYVKVNKAFTELYSEHGFIEAMKELNYENANGF
ncbi:hypothetical protein [Curvivirga aplysinae]|uniref:hypothetical protein n=1 Tax=Curvivirga aplysinae TaxID=2529852 RepID=UPI0012BBBFD2|nr:hypothetical protein [Curvivirga aplysinae]MTI08591.1 hypothetical protein [Curvivirga aplysinae]